MRVRLLKLSTWTYTQVDNVLLPDLESLEDLSILFKSLGTLLKPYAESFTDPNIVSSMLDGSITDWTVSDLESLNIILKDSKYKLVISQEDQLEETFKDTSYCYLLIDSSIKYLGVFPTTKFIIKDGSVEETDYVEIVKSLIPETLYFNTTKFMVNKFNNLYSSCAESKKLLGVYDEYTLRKLFDLIADINKEILIIKKV